jgi:2-oxoglutarate/2-oxoacid ferredoxin oxidoreductase subunit alpha
MYGRHGESPMIVLAMATPADGFAMAFEAVRLTTKYMTPVLLLSDSFLANSAEPMRIPAVDSFPDLRVASPPLVPFMPYSRDPRTLARPWVAPGTAGCEHRVGGLEKEDVTGTVSYDAVNHQKMTDLRAAKIRRVADDIPPAELSGPESGQVLVVSWGSTYGAIAGAMTELHKEDKPVAHVHLRYLNPLPHGLAEMFSRFRHVLVPENNSGHLSVILRSQFDIKPVGLNKVQGRPFLIREVRAKIEELLSHD